MVLEKEWQQQAGARFYLAGEQKAEKNLRCLTRKKVKEQEKHVKINKGPLLRAFVV